MNHQTTINHLGGNKTFAMIGGRDLVFGRDHLQFDLARRLKVNRVIVTLQRNDLYSITLYHVWGIKIRRSEHVTDIFCENLRERLGEMLEMETRL